MGSDAAHPARPRRALAGILAAATAAALAGCGSGGSGTNTNTVGAGSNAPSNQLTVYSALPLGGGARSRSDGIVNGEKLALKESGGRVGPFRVNYVSLDDSDPSTGSWTPEQASSNAKLAAQDKTAIAYLGDWDSGATAVSLPIINGANILQISPASTYVGFTQSTFAGKGEPDRYYPLGRRTFGRLVPSDQVQAAAQVEYAKRAGVSNVFLIRDREVFDAELGAIFAAQAPLGGLALAGDQIMSANPSDDVTLARQVTNSGAQAVLYAGQPTLRAAALLDALLAANPSLKLFSPYFVAEPDFLRALGPAQRSLYVTSPVLPLGMYPATARRFASAYRTAFASSPGPYALYGYEAMKLVLTLIREAGSRGNDRQAVVNRFFATRGRQSVIGRYSIEASGDTTLSRYGGDRVRGGRLAFDRLLIH
ncbi:MAG TPA: branched-chain amino acid ABC transporter substrate-binding protein [Solirubrobacteraceae bacterium]|nr:branched-chain amino acid ABC transporter substrate-binding protein [Solirubrobacteraceae bacterium]